MSLRESAGRLGPRFCNPLATTDIRKTGRMAVPRREETMGTWLLHAEGEDTRSVRCDARRALLCEIRPHDGPASRPVERSPW